MKKLKLLYLLFIILIMSVAIFPEEVPKEVEYPSNKLSLSASNEVLYDRIPYTGKITINDMSYMNLKNGHLEGETFLENENFKSSVNIVDGKLEGECIIKNIVLGKYVNYLIDFKNGEIKAIKYYNETLRYNFIFDSNGLGNGNLEDSDRNKKLEFKDGIAKQEWGYIKVSLGKRKDLIIYSYFDENSKLMSEDNTGLLINREVIEKIWFKKMLLK